MKSDVGTSIRSSDSTCTICIVFIITFTYRIVVTKTINCITSTTLSSMILIKASLLLFGSLNTSKRKTVSTTTKRLPSNNISASLSSGTKTDVDTNTNNDFFKKSTQSIQQFLSSPFEQTLLSPSMSMGNQLSQEAENTIESFIATFNNLSSSSTGTAVGIQKMVTAYFDRDVEYTDTSFYRTVTGSDELLKHFLLFRSSDSSSLSINSGRQIVIDDIVAGKGKGGQSKANVSDSNDDSDDSIVNVCVQYHLEELLLNDGGENDSADDSGVIIPDSTGITFYTLRKGKISNLFNVLEPPSPKPGDAGLKLLKAASTVLDRNNDVVEEIKGKINKSDGNNDENIVETYFNSWNERNMDNAVKCFTPNCVYDDLQYDTSFEGKDKMEQHLNNVAECLPSSFQFKIDNLVTSNNGGKVGVLWHVESNGNELPFTRGCSFYTTTSTERGRQKQQLIQTGVDIPEPAVIKSGAINSTVKKFTAEPVRLLPLTMWILYMYIVFLSDGILPGANALQLEQRTWEEVRDLSLNFFLVSPLLHLPFAPVVHPMLEGVFNLLLAWAGMFAGFLSDERKDKPNILEFGPIVIGMQFLTSAFLLPYLAVRSSEDEEGDVQNTVYKEDITGSIQATVGEWKPLGGLLGGVGSASIVWAFLARPEFGAFSERYDSFKALLSIDRVGSSFLVDLAIFALFQGWFVDDDMKRRGVGSGEMVALKNLAKFVPFFGLAFYLTFRPPLPSREQVL